MLLEIILLKELLQTPLSGGKFTIPAKRETVVVPVVEPVQGKTVGEALVDLTYPEGWDADKIVLNLDPVAVAAFKQSEETKKALRGL